jgi:hypothetical protein
MPTQSPAQNGPLGPNPQQPGDYLISLDGGSYTVGNGDPFAGSTIYIDPSTDMIDFADIFLAPDISSPPTLEFDDILHQDAGPGANQWEATIEDTGGTDQLNLVLDDWSALEIGSEGATVDSTSNVTALGTTSLVLDSDITGTLDVPAPAALPVFATALGLLGVFRRRWRRGPAKA